MPRRPSRGPAPSFLPQRQPRPPTSFPKRRTPEKKLHRSCTEITSTRFSPTSPTSTLFGGDPTVQASNLTRKPSMSESFGGNLTEKSVDHGEKRREFEPQTPDAGLNWRAFDPLAVKCPPQTVEFEPQTVHFLGLRPSYPRETSHSPTMKSDKWDFIRRGQHFCWRFFTPFVDGCEHRLTAKHSTPPIHTSRARDTNPIAWRCCVS